MSDRLAKQVAERLRDIEDWGRMGDLPAVRNALPALAELVERSETLRQEVNELAPLTGWPPGMVVAWDEALSRVAESLGVNDVSAPGAPPADTKENT